MPRDGPRAVWALVASTGFLPMKRQPLYLINTLTSPFSFLFLLYIIEGASFLPYGVAGGMVLTVLSIGTGLQTDLTHYKSDMKFQEMLVGSPVTAGSYVLGIALSEFVYSIPGMTVFFLLSLVYCHYIFLGALVIFGTLVLVWVFASALGYTLATYLSDVRETFAVTPLISIFLTVVPPVYYELTKLPVWLRPMALLAPTTWAASLVKSALGIQGSGLLCPGSPNWACPGGNLTIDGGLLDAAVLVLSASILFVLAWKKAQWRES